MNGTHRIVIAGALSALMGASACVEEEPEDEIVDVAADALAAPAVTFLAGAPASVDGMCVSVAAIDYFAPRCTLADVPEFVAYAADDVVLTSFLSTVLAGNATLQCRATGAPAPGYCVDVVDRAPGGAALGTDQLGNRKNYFVAYASNATGSVVKGHWNAQLDLDGGAPPAPDYRAAPVELARVGSFEVGGYWRPLPMSEAVHLRVMTFDPRDCANCGTYSGPAFQLTKVSTPAGLTRSGLSAAEAGTFWPAFKYADASDCSIESEPAGAYVDTLVSAGACKDELRYQLFGR